MADDLHARLSAAIRARLEVARATATPGLWTAHGLDMDPWVADEGGSPVASFTQAFSEGLIPLDVEDARHIAANNPAATIRRCEALLRVVERHAPEPHPSPTRPGVIQCGYCAEQCHSRSGLGCDTPADAVWPCLDIRDLAAGEGIEVGDG
jgi:hypothetical protein